LSVDPTADYEAARFLHPWEDAMVTFVDLPTITEPVALDTLTPEQLKELQRGLSQLAFPVGKIDGLIGPKTRNAWAEFKTDLFPGNPTLIATESIALLVDTVAKLPSNQPFDSEDRQAVIQAITHECVAQGLHLPTQIAYVLATTKWETAQTFRPVEEAFWLKKAESYRKKLKYYPFYGRGYVQLTWKNNYQSYGDILDLPMVSTPSIALDPQVALFVLVHGFKVGTFTGRKITDFIDEQATDFVRARRCINGTDKSQEIAELAQEFLATLT
jgi:predicted chitinase